MDPVDQTQSSDLCCEATKACRLFFIIIFFKYVCKFPCRKYYLLQTVLTQE